jgi:hypothetical protein
MSRPINPAGDAGGAIESDPGRPATNAVESPTPAEWRADDARSADQPTVVERPAGSEIPDRSPTSTTTEPRLDHRELLVRQRERFGGMKIGSAFFGWLAATGLIVILVAVLAAVGVGTGTTVDQARTLMIGLVGGIVLLIILFVAYLAGGYVAGRMARFNGARQGLAVWLWGVVMTAVIAGVAALVGSQQDIPVVFNLPRLQIGEQTGAVATVIGIAIAAAVALVGAILGGLAGMRFHRRVDRTDVLDRAAADRPD